MTGLIYEDEGRCCSAAAPTRVRKQTAQRLSPIPQIGNAKRPTSSANGGDTTNATPNSMIRPKPISCSIVSLSIDQVRVAECGIISGSSAS